MKSFCSFAWSRTVLLSALLAASACGGKVSSGPCQGVNPAPECGVPCTVDLDCGSGFYCGPGDMCTSDCTPGGSQCGTDEVCSDRGRCVPGDVPDADPGCPDVTVDLTPVVPTVMLVIDKSGSMGNNNFGEINGVTVTRWEAVHYALTDSVAGAVTNLEASVLFGGALYSATSGMCLDMVYSAGSPPGAPTINNRDAIDDMMTNNSTGGRTPTGPAIDAVVPLLVSVADSSSPQIIVLATDGAPNFCDPNAGTSEAESIAAVQNAFSQTQSIATYILSVGPDVATDHLAEMANAGQGLPLTPPNADFFIADTPDALEDAFAQIIGSARSCTFTLDGTVTGDGSDGTVTLDTGSGPVTLVLGTDWNLANPTTIELMGATCDDYLVSTIAIFVAKFPCGVVVQ